MPGIGVRLGDLEQSGFADSAFSHRPSLELRAVTGTHARIGRCADVFAKGVLGQPASGSSGSKILADSRTGSRLTRSRRMRDNVLRRENALSADSPNRRNALERKGRP